MERAPLRVRGEGGRAGGRTTSNSWASALHLDLAWSARARDCGESSPAPALDIPRPPGTKRFVCLGLVPLEHQQPRKCTDTLLLPPSCEIHPPRVLARAHPTARPLAG